MRRRRLLYVGIVGIVFALPFLMLGALRPKENIIVAGIPINPSSECFLKYQVKQEENRLQFVQILIMNVTRGEKITIGKVLVHINDPLQPSRTAMDGAYYPTGELHDSYFVYGVTTPMLVTYSCTAPWVSGMSPREVELIDDVKFTLTLTWNNETHTTPTITVHKWESEQDPYFSMRMALWAGIVTINATDIVSVSNNLYLGNTP